MMNKELEAIKILEELSEKNWRLLGQLMLMQEEYAELKAALAQKEQVKPWVGLTQESFSEACRLAEDGNYLTAFQRIQAELKEKNK